MQLEQNFSQRRSMAGAVRVPGPRGGGLTAAAARGAPRRRARRPLRPAEVRQVEALARSAPAATRGLLRRRRPRERPAAGEPCDGSRPPHSGVRSRRVPRVVGAVRAPLDRSEAGDGPGARRVPGARRRRAGGAEPSAEAPRSRRASGRASAARWLIAAHDARARPGTDGAAVWRAAEIMKVGPLGGGWIAKALRLADPARGVEAY